MPTRKPTAAGTNDSRPRCSDPSSAGCSKLQNEAATITLTQFYVMQALQELYPDHNPYKTLKRTRMLDIVSGTDYVRKEFGKRLKVDDIKEFWMKDTEDFKTLSKTYYLYR